jgi:hypothetical protein
MFVLADQRLDDLGHALHPLFEAAFGAVGRVKDLGEILKAGLAAQGAEEAGGLVDGWGRRSRNAC